eukprot:TRINITY_DN893_c4_g1_i1.p1 TRINITY_DN893_c4_g1~~TRINITY_DN893_c4_g1_i1.p1  ORF type:complete len:926 (+),score=235.28 TRINITY_DN893_c4_g1_i1:74-2851(+)
MAAAAAAAEAAEAEEGGGDLPLVVDEEMMAWLKSEGLQSYAAVLADNGYTEYSFLLELDAAEVDEMLKHVPLRHGHAMKVRKRLARLRPAPCPQDVGGAAVGMPVLSAAVSSSVRETSSFAATAVAASGAVDLQDKASYVAGTRVTLIGLEKRPELNGVTGTLLAWDKEASRWQFRADGGESIKVRNDNLKPLPNQHVARATSTSSSPAAAVPGGEAKDAASGRRGGASLEVPEELRCPITQDVMERPVFTSDGHTYERASISKWLEAHETSPATGRELPDRVLRPNHAMRAQVIAWRERNGLPALPPWEPEPQEVVQQQASSSPTNARNGGGQNGQATIFSMTHWHTQGGLIVQNDALIRFLEETPLAMSEIATQYVAQANPDTPMIRDQRILAAHAVNNDVRLREVALRLLRSNPAALRRYAHEFTGGPGNGQPSPHESALFRAVREGECSVVEQMLGHQSGLQLLRECNRNGDSMLHCACWFGHARLVKLLLAKRHPLHPLATNRSTPLHYACWQDHEEVAKELLEAAAEADRRMMAGDTPLHQAAWNNNAAVLKCLCEHKADVGSLKDDSDSALCLASARGHLEAVKVLLEYSPPLRGSETLLPGTVTYFNRQGLTALHRAGMIGKAPVVQALLEAKADVNALNYYGETPLGFVVVSGHFDAVQLMLEHKANPNIVFGQNAGFISPLLFSIANGRARITKLLVEHGACVNRGPNIAGSREGIWPLKNAASHHCFNAPAQGETTTPLQVLLEARADVNETNDFGISPLHLCFEKAQQPGPHRGAAVRLLLTYKADVEAQQKDGERPIHLAVRGHLHEALKVLLEHRANVAATSLREGDAPLHIAARLNSKECGEALLAAGADRRQRNSAGHQAWEVARLGGLSQDDQQFFQAPTQVAAASSPQGSAASPGGGGGSSTETIVV